MCTKNFDGGWKRPYLLMWPKNGQKEELLDLSAKKNFTHTWINQPLFKWKNKNFFLCGFHDFLCHCMFDNRFMFLFSVSHSDHDYIYFIFYFFFVSCSRLFSFIFHTKSNETEAKKSKKRKKCLFCMINKWISTKIVLSWINILYVWFVCTCRSTLLNYANIYLLRLYYSLKLSFDYHYIMCISY